MRVSFYFLVSFLLLRVVFSLSMEVFWEDACVQDGHVCRYVQGVCRVCMQVCFGARVASTSVWQRSTRPALPSPPHAFASHETSKHHELKVS